MLCIVVPTYNEADNIGDMLRRLFDLGLVDLYVFIIDDLSPDGTAKIAKGMSDEFDNRVLVYEREGKMGLGTAYVFGFIKVLEMFSSEYENFNVAQMDADFSHNPKYIPEMIKMLDKYEVVVGSRYINSGKLDIRKVIARKLLSRYANKIIRWISGIRVNDVTSGFKIFRSGTLERIDWNRIKCTGFGFQVEIAYQCDKNNFKVYEIPIEFPDRINGCSKMSFGIIWEAIWKISWMRFKHVVRMG